MGLMDILGEECILPKGSNTNFVAKIYKNSGSDDSSLYSEKSFQSFEFGIKHYAGKVKYSAKQFLSKNKDALPREVVVCALSSQNPLVNEIFRGDVEMEQPTRGRMSRRGSGWFVGETVWSKFKVQLDELMENLGKTNSRYIRCVKPNMQKLPGEVDMSHTLEQIRCAGIVEAVTMSRQAYPNRLPFAKILDLFEHMDKRQNKETMSPMKKRMNNFVKKYRKKDGKSEQVKTQSLLDYLFEHKEDVWRLFTDKCDSSEVGEEPSPPFVMGKSVVYFSDGALEFLEVARLSSFDKSATVIQCFVRKQKAISRYNKMRAHAKLECKSKRRKSKKLPMMCILPCIFVCRKSLNEVRAEF